MSTSSSAPVRQRDPGSAIETAPFPYAEVASSNATSESGAATQDHSQLQQAEALAQARQQGQQEGRTEMGAALQREREQVARALHEFATERGNYYRRVEGEVVQLALAIARKILHREAQLDPHALAGIVRVTIERMDAGTKVSLHVHPREASEWRHYFAGQLEGELALEVHEDPVLGAGECRIETALGATEVGFESQIKEIETGLLDLLAERPGSK
jgi:flagellar assembly protein FliH